MPPSFCLLKILLGFSVEDELHCLLCLSCCGNDEPFILLESFAPRLEVSDRVLECLFGIQSALVGEEGSPDFSNKFLFGVRVAPEEIAQISI